MTINYYIIGANSNDSWSNELMSESFDFTEYPLLKEELLNSYTHIDNYFMKNMKIPIDILQRVQKGDVVDLSLLEPKNELGKEIKKYMNKYLDYDCVLIYSHKTLMRREGEFIIEYTFQWNHSFGLS